MVPGGILIHLLQSNNIGLHRRNEISDTAQIGAQLTVGSEALIQPESAAMGDVEGHQNEPSFCCASFLILIWNGG